MTVYLKTQTNANLNKTDFKKKYLYPMYMDLFFVNIFLFYYCWDARWL